ncbi:MAG: hypothetical protein V1787_05420 [Candidatus Micrarchaeota archaeon]
MPENTLHSLVTQIISPGLRGQYFDREDSDRVDAVRRRLLHLPGSSEEADPELLKEEVTDGNCLVLLAPLLELYEYFHERENAESKKSVRRIAEEVEGRVGTLMLSEAMDAIDTRKSWKQTILGIMREPLPPRPEQQPGKKTRIDSPQATGVGIVIILVLLIAAAFYIYYNRPVALEPPEATVAPTIEPIPEAVSATTESTPTPTATPTPTLKLGALDSGLKLLLLRDRAGAEIKRIASDLGFSVETEETLQLESDFIGGIHETRYDMEGEAYIANQPMVQRSYFAWQILAFTQGRRFDGSLQRVEFNGSAYFKGLHNDVGPTQRPYGDSGAVFCDSNSSILLLFAFDQNFKSARTPDGNQTSDYLARRLTNACRAWVQEPTACLDRKCAQRASNN